MLKVSSQEHGMERIQVFEWVLSSKAVWPIAEAECLGWRLRSKTDENLPQRGNDSFGTEVSLSVKVLRCCLLNLGQFRAFWKIVWTCSVLEGLVSLPWQCTCSLCFVCAWIFGLKQNVIIHPLATLNLLLVTSFFPQKSRWH
jgi:hypothetical protein